MENVNQNNQISQQPFKCSGDCLKCRKLPNERREQWQYCAAQFTYNSMRMIGDMQESLKSMQGAIDELKAKIEAIQNSEANVLDPTASEENLEISNSGIPEIPNNHITPIGAGVNS